MRSIADRWLASIPSFRETSFRVATLRSDLARLDLAELGEALEEIARAAEQADARAREVLTAFAPTFADPDVEETIVALRQLAQERRYFALARLLRRRDRPSPHHAPEPEERGTIDLPGRTLTLGERKSLARGHDRDQLDRLLRDPHPLVIKNLLSNPRITEEDVIRLAAKRPTYPDVQAEIGRSERWSIRPRVRLALAKNPYTPVPLSVPLLPLLLRQELAEIAHATELPGVVRAAAMDLLDRRPPVPADEDPGEH
ncbi:MAG: hypothetical protein U0414_32295 [Polyangiaceae bacterium]